MERLSESGRDGIRIPDFTLAARELLLAWALESASLADLAGAGDIGDTIGVVMEFFSTTTGMSPTAEFSLITTTLTAPADFMAVAFTVTQGEDSAGASMDFPLHTAKLEPILAPSAVSIMEEPREAFPLAANRASVEVPTEVAAFMGAEATVAVGTGDSVQY
jgi:hypothetical protein